MKSWLALLGEESLLGISTFQIKYISRLAAFTGQVRDSFLQDLGSIDFSGKQPDLNSPLVPTTIHRSSMYMLHLRAQITEMHPVHLLVVGNATSSLWPCSR